MGYVRSANEVIDLLLSVRLLTVPPNAEVCHGCAMCRGMGRRDSESSGGKIRRSSHTTPVAAIREGILDNGAIGK